VAQLFEGLVRDELSAVKPVHAAVGGDEDVSVRVFIDRADPAVGKALFDVVIRKLRSIPTADAAGRADPQSVFTIFEERLHAIISKTLSRSEPGCFTVGQTRYALVVGAEPKGAGVIRKTP